MEPTDRTAVDINDEDPKKGIAAATALLNDNNLPINDENIFIAATCKEKGVTYLKGDAVTMVRKNVEKEAPAAAAAPAKAAPAPSAAGGLNIIAHIPGTITRVLKNQGNTVAYGEPIMVYQTGDVEIEIPATASGTIQSIAVAPGSVVEANSLLATITG